MFDAIGLRKALSDIYDTGVTDDNLSLLYEANKDIEMAVKTNNGLTERQSPLGMASSTRTSWTSVSWLHIVQLWSCA